MNIEILHRLEYLDHLISSKTTGDPNELAKKLSISERAVYHLLNLLRCMDAPISYDRHLRSYYYEGDGSFNFRFKYNQNFKETPIIRLSPVSSQDFIELFK